MSVGGNREASRQRRAALQRLHLRGVRRQRHVFRSGGGHARLSLATGSPISGSVSVLPVVASVIIGGASLLGGVGSVIQTGVGVLIIGVLATAMDMANVSSWDQDIVLGAVLLLVVLVGTLGQAGKPGTFRRAMRRERSVTLAEPTREA